MRDLDRLAQRRGAAFGRRQRLLQGAEHERQRRAEFVTDVGEERRLGAVEFSQRLGALALAFVFVGPRDRRRNLRRHQFNETFELGVQRPMRIEARHKIAERRAAFGAAHGRDQRMLGRLLPMGERKVLDDILVDPGCDDLSRARLSQRPSRQRVVVFDARRGFRVGAAEAVDRGERRALFVGEIGQRKRQIARLLGETVFKRRHHFRAGRGRRQSRAEIAQGRQLPLADDALRHLGDDAEHALRRPGVVGERGIGERVIGFLGKAAALQIQQQRFVPRRHARGEHTFDARADGGPDLGPHMIGAAADHPTALDADRRQISVVAEKCQLRSPSHPHGEARGQHHPHHGAQALRPPFRRTQRRLAPITGAHQLANGAVPCRQIQEVGGAAA